MSGVLQMTVGHSGSARYRLACRVLTNEEKGLGRVERDAGHAAAVFAEGVLARALAELVHQHCLGTGKPATIKILHAFQECPIIQRPLMPCPPSRGVCTLAS